MGGRRVHNEESISETEDVEGHARSGFDRIRTHGWFRCSCRGGSHAWRCFEHQHDLLEGRVGTGGCIYPEQLDRNSNISRCAVKAHGIDRPAPAGPRGLLDGLFQFGPAGVVRADTAPAGASSLLNTRLAKAASRAATRTLVGASCSGLAIDAGLMYGSTCPAEGRLQSK